MNMQEGGHVGLPSKFVSGCEQCFDQFLQWLDQSVDIFNLCADNRKLNHTQNGLYYLILGNICKNCVIICCY